jgi:hypothetical protein
MSPSRHPRRKPDPQIPEDVPPPPFGDEPDDARKPPKHEPAPAEPPPEPLPPPHHEPPIPVHEQ